VDDGTAVRLQKVEWSLRLYEKLADIQARGHVAVLVAALTFGTTAAVAGLVRTVPVVPAAVFTLASGSVIVAQLRGLAGVAKALRRSHAEAYEEADRLIAQGGASNVDESPADL
jgi:hypothetical protein